MMTEEMPQNLRAKLNNLTNIKVAKKNRIGITNIVTLKVRLIKISTKHNILQIQIASLLTEIMMLMTSVKIDNPQLGGKRLHNRNNIMNNPIKIKTKIFEEVKISRISSMKGRGTHLKNINLSNQINGKNKVALHSRKAIEETSREYGLKNKKNKTINSIHNNKVRNLKGR
jgi:hypothetical protein